MKHLFSTKVLPVIRMVDNAEDETRLLALDKALKKGTKIIVSYVVPGEDEDPGTAVYYETVVADGKTAFADLAKIGPNGDAPSVTVDWDDIDNKPVVIAAGADADAARTAIGAGTSSVALVTVTGAAAGIAPVAATAGTATSAARSDHKHTGPGVILTGYAIGTAGALAATDTANQAFGKLEARVLALEGA